MPLLPPEERDDIRLPQAGHPRAVLSWTTNRPLRRLVALFTLGIGVIASLLAGLQVKHAIEEKAVREFAKTCDEIRLKIQGRLNAYAVLLQGAKALFGASEEVTRNEWRTYVEMLRAGDFMPGHQGIGFVGIVKQGDLDAHERAIRAGGFPDYSVHPHGQRDIYGPIIFIEPFKGRNLRAFGFDMLSEPVRREAMETARDTGNPALSGKVTLMQEDGQDVQAGALMYAPVYRRGDPIKTVPERRAAIVGWVYSPYRMDNLIKGTIPALAGQADDLLDLEIYDGSTPSPNALLFDSRRFDDPHGPHPLLQQQRTIDFNGRKWLLVFKSAPGAGIDLAPAWITALAGLVITSLVFGMLLVIYKRSDAQLATEKLAEQIRGMAFHDALTKLPNRVLLRDRLAMALAGAKRSGNFAALMMIDLDNFKPLNDEHGHAAGDILLVEVAHRMRDCVRETDTVARLGGDEFIVLLGALSGDEEAACAEAMAVAEKIRRTLAEPYFIAPERSAGVPIEHRCSSSIGLVVFSGEAHGQSELIRKADDAMYRAKKEGRNRVWFSKPSKASSVVV